MSLNWKKFSQDDDGDGDDVIDETLSNVRHKVARLSQSQS